MTNTSFSGFGGLPNRNPHQAGSTSSQNYGQHRLSHAVEFATGQSKKNDVERRQIEQELKEALKPKENPIRMDEKRVIALNLLRKGVEIDVIAPSTGLSIEEVQQLQQQLNGSAQG